MQLLCTLSPAFWCLLTLAAQQVAGLAVPRKAPAECPQSCLGILPSGSAFDTSRCTPDELTLVLSCVQSECGNLTMEEMRRSCVNDLVFGFAKMGESSQIAMCLSKNKEQAHKRQFTAVLDGINIVDASVAGIEGSITDIGGNVITVDTSRGFLVLWPGIEA